MLTAYVKNYGSFWCAQVLDENDHYRGMVRRTSKTALIDAVRENWDKIAIKFVK